MERKTKVKLGVGNYADYGCRIICKCGNPEYFNKNHFVGNQHYSCDKCDIPLVVVNEGTPYYVGRPVFPIGEKWGNDL